MHELYASVIKGSLSLDRVTFLLFSPKLSAWTDTKRDTIDNSKRIDMFSDLIEHKIELSEDFPQGIPSELYTKHYRTSSGVDIQFGAKMPARKKILSIDDAVPEYEYFSKYYCLRIEYNPNETDLLSLSELLKPFGSCSLGTEVVKVSRLDIAIDFPVALVPQLVLCKGMRKSFTASGSNGLESIYFGSRNSKYYFRLYNKRQEILDVDKIDIGYDLWRLELEAKVGFFLDSVPNFGPVFERFSFYNDCAVSSGDWLVDLIRSQSMIYGLQNVLRTMPKRTQSRYRKIFQSMDLDLLEAPSKVFYREFPSAIEKLTCDIYGNLGILGGISCD